MQFFGQRLYPVNRALHRCWVTMAGAVKMLHKGGQPTEPVQ